MVYGIEDDIMPLFLINSFLEVGKIQLLDFTMQQGHSRTEGKTLLIMCEEDDTEYDEKKSKENKVAAVLMDDMGKLTPQYFNEPKVIYQPEHVLTEQNSMQNQDDLKLPDDWAIYQQITIIDGSTFELYVQNMKPLLRIILRGSELIIVNRCDGVPDDKLAAYRRTIHAVNQESEIVLEGKEGEIEQAALEEDLPYDLGVDVIKIKPEDYSAQYIDYVDQPERHKDKVVGLTAMVLKSLKLPKDQFVPGHTAMTCREADMTFPGFICKRPGAEDHKTKQWVKARAKIGIGYQKDYHGEGPVFYAEHVERAEEIKDVVQFQE